MVPCHICLSLRLTRTAICLCRVSQPLLTLRTVSLLSDRTGRTTSDARTRETNESPGSCHRSLAERDQVHAAGVKVHSASVWKSTTRSTRWRRCRALSLPPVKSIDSSSGRASRNVSGRIPTTGSVGTTEPRSHIRNIPELVPVSGGIHDSKYGDSGLRRLELIGTTRKECTLPYALPRAVNNCVQSPCISFVKIW